MNTLPSEMTEMQREGRSDFCRLQLSGDGGSMLLLGYRETLTAAEYAIIKALLEADTPIHKSLISEITRINEKSVPVHISNINKKALPITGRKLIEGNRRGEYGISEHI